MGENENNFTGLAASQPGVGNNESFNLNDLMHELRSMRREFNTETHEIKNLMEEKFENLIKDGKETRVKVDQHEVRIKAQEKEMVRRNLIIYGLTEGEQENFGDLRDKLGWIFNEKMELNIGHNEIDTFFRMGRKNPGKSRPVMVKLVSGWRKSQVLLNTSKLVGTKVFIDSDLTKEEQTERKAMVELMNMFRRKGDHAVVRGCKLYVNKVWYKPNEEKKEGIQGNANKAGDGKNQTPGNSGMSGLEKNKNTQGQSTAQKKRLISPSVEVPTGSKLKRTKHASTKQFRSNSLVLERAAMEKFLQDVSKPGSEENIEPVEKEVDMEQEEEDTNKELVMSEADKEEVEQTGVTK